MNIMMQSEIDWNFSRSIHPRVEGGRTVHPKVNTAKPHKGKGKLAKALKWRDTRRTDMANTMSSPKNRNNPKAFKMPGSMKIN